MNCGRDEKNDEATNEKIVDFSRFHGRVARSIASIMIMKQTIKMKMEYMLPVFLDEVKDGDEDRGLHQSAEDRQDKV